MLEFYCKSTQKNDIILGKNESRKMLFFGRLKEKKYDVSHMNRHIDIVVIFEGATFTSFESR